MNDRDMKARLKELYLPPADEFVLVDVPDMRYVMIDGRGAASRVELDHAVKWLFTVIHPIKRFARERMGKDFVDPPLEGLWWADDTHDFICGNRDKMNWRMMIVYEPEWLTAEMFADGLATARKTLGDAPSSLRIDSLHEGLSAQIMYVGPPKKESPTVARLHREFLPAHGLTAHGRHHEIYLTDPNRVAPQRMRTVLRQPVRSVS